VQQLRIAERSDPLSRQIQGQLGGVLLSAGRYGEAAEHCQNASGLDRMECLGRIRLAEGKIDQAYSCSSQNAFRAGLLTRTGGQAVATMRKRWRRPK